MLSVLNDLSCYTNCIFDSSEICNCPNFHSVPGNKKYLELIRKYNNICTTFIRQNLFSSKFESLLL